MVNSSEKKPATRRYHPYQDLQVPIRTLYELPTSPDYLFDEEVAVQRCSWSENLQYYTGSSYLAGAVTGGLKGSLEGLRAAEPGETLKLRTNRVLNSGGHIGRKFGNTLGVLGLIFAGLESGILHFRGTGDIVFSVSTDTLLVQDAISEKAIAQVRTVYSYVGECKALNSYSDAIQNTLKLGYKEVCQNTPCIRDTNHLFHELPLLKDKLEEYIDKGLENKGLA